ncbi:MAG TPA: excinuclease ABC subunit UvrB [Methanobacterium sp.]|jgi:excinuclease ABC subunit B|nr:MAG: excinuclease ABC subunit UvrB [Methanobacterium sp.]HOI71437.1 excinuclease ABC subunit UvrB [Methanobacterium sp.]
MSEFKLESSYRPLGDQPKAIKSLSDGIRKGLKHQTLLGVTGSGKTFTMANVIKEVQKPTLVMSHNKTLAAQLYEEFRELFPDNAVEYFVSYYDYYQPEAYIPHSDTYIDKEASINDEIDMMRHSTTQSLLSRDDVIVVSSVSCIYGIGSPEDYSDQVLALRVGDTMDREVILASLVKMQYDRNDIEFTRGTFRVRGDVIDVYPAHGKVALRIELFGDDIENISTIDPLLRSHRRDMDQITIFPAKHFVIADWKLQKALNAIEEELQDRLTILNAQNKLVEAQRLEQRTRYDMEMLREMGYCPGIENYSMHLSGRKWGETPYTLLKYFPEDYLTIIDESHVTVPQIGGMYAGDKARKDSLVDYGFRLPSARENRPLNFQEFEALQNQVIYVSATPAKYELGLSPNIVEQIIRPTGLVDPEIEIHPVKGQVEHLLGEINKKVENHQRVLVTTLTKKMAEDLTDYYARSGLKVRYLHSEIVTLERIDIIDDLRRGEFDCLVGVNLLREGLDLPEVGMVGILDADKEGFLRSESSLIQTIGRAARNVEGQVMIYADEVTESIRKAVETTNRRRQLQMDYNKKHNITPRSTSRSLKKKTEKKDMIMRDDIISMPKDELHLFLQELRKDMKKAAQMLDFEEAAKIRDKILIFEELTDE